MDVGRQPEGRTQVGGREGAVEKLAIRKVHQPGWRAVQPQNRLGGGLMLIVAIINVAPGEVLWLLHFVACLQPQPAGCTHTYLSTMKSAGGRRGADINFVVQHI